MKKLIALPLLFLVLSCGTSKNLNKETETYPTQYKEVTVSVNPYLEKLGIEDKNAVVIVMSKSSMRYFGSQNSFLVMLSDGRMFKYATSDKDYTKLKSIEVTDASEKRRLTKTVNSINDIDTDTFKNPPARAYITDCTGYDLEIYNGTTGQFFDVYAPEAYIEDKLPRYKERRKLLKVLETLDFYNELFKS